ncbi:MAG: hypothetical protein WDN08_05525 [Rhizomicrobium sp.]
MARAAGKPTHTLTTITRVHFEDRGQDFTWFDLRQTGELVTVIDCGPCQQAMWIGCVILRGSLKEGAPPAIRLKNEQTFHPLRYRALKIVKRRELVAVAV